MAIPGLARLRTAKPRRFVLRRIEDVSGVSGVGIVAEGVVFSDGKVSLHWTVALKSTAVYDSIEDLEAIHGHNGATRVEWIDAEVRVMDFDQMTEDQLRAVVDTGKQAEQELSRRWAREAEAVEARVQRLLRGDASAAFKPNDLRFAAYQRCACGAGMAYPTGCGTKGSWHCSAILRGTASRELVHSEPQSFQFYEVKSENQPSANGATTRDAGAVE